MMIEDLDSDNLSFDTWQEADKRKRWVAHRQDLGSIAFDTKIYRCFGYPTDKRIEGLLGFNRECGSI